MPSLDQLSQRNQVFVLGFSLFKGFVFFRLSYFNCSDWQLFAIFIAGKSVGPRYVLNGKQNEAKLPNEIGVYHLHVLLSSNLQRVPGTCLTQPMVKYNTG